MNSGEEVPPILGKTSLCLGLRFLVDPPDDEPYEVYSVAYLPGHPKQLTGDFAGQSEASAGLKSRTSQVDGIRPFCFDFHPGDPLGEYRVEVFINGSSPFEYAEWQETMLMVAHSASNNGNGVNST